jgi:hypothetical protein
MNEYEVCLSQPPMEDTPWVTVHAEEVAIDNSGRLVFSAGEQAVECFQSFAWSRWRLADHKMWCVR